MKFLFKTVDSKILSNGIIYKKNNSANNAALKDLLIKEQKNFCAYTERFIDPTSSAEVEHFNPAKKYNDDYYNYYAVLRYANLHKLKFEKKYANASFFDNLFFQDKEAFTNRFRFENGEYKSVNENDEEAIGLIEYLGFNSFALTQHRSDHIKRLKNTLQNFPREEWDEYFATFPSELSFATAIESAFTIDLSEIINNLS